MKISNREIIIAAVAILVLLGIGYVINNNSSDNKSEEQNQEDQVNLDENENSDAEGDKEEDAETPEGVESTEPAASKEIALADVPNAIVVRTSKELAGGSEIKVVSDKNLDVVTARNRISADLRTLTAPINVTEPGTYTVTYNINWADGTKSVGKYTVKVTE